MFTRAFTHTTYKKNSFMASTPSNVLSGRWNRYGHDKSYAHDSIRLLAINLKSLQSTDVDINKRYKATRYQKAENNGHVHTTIV